MIDIFCNYKNKKQVYFESKFEVGDYFYFGREDAGLPTILDKMLKLVLLFL